MPEPGGTRRGFDAEPRSDTALTDEELTALALGTVPFQPDGEATVPFAVYLGHPGSPLPEWYMPAAVTRARWWRWPVVAVVVCSFLFTASLGLCATYGAISIP